MKKWGFSPKGFNHKGHCLHQAGKGKYPSEPGQADNTCLSQAGRFNRITQILPQSLTNLANLPNQTNLTNQTNLMDLTNFPWG
jgi:hypothetical protein